jgi:23S rRNA (cytidine1920-2'-O)/16S rRNA (cytidine1409-2'-O)-methyltransferase
MTAPARQRLDLLLVERGLAPSRAQAQALIMAGRVRVAGAVVDKAGSPVAEDAELAVSEPPRYVSRGGEKLETALTRFGIDVSGADCLDVGASTGGFSDCLLQHGASRVIALDVGRGQLHERLRADPRVTVMERVNARHLTSEMLPYAPNLVTADLSFISLRLVLPAVAAVAKPPWRGVVLVKPQFEAGRGETRKGVVREPEVRRRVLGEIVEFVRGLALVPLGVCDSSHPGPAGNREFLLYMTSPDHPEAKRDVEIDAQIRDAVGSG